MEKTHFNCVIATGRDYDLYINLIKYQESLGSIKILGILSECRSGMGIDGYPSLSISDTLELDYDYLIITDTESYDEISKILSEKFKINREKIISSIAFRQPLFDFKKYIRLKESHTTIISDDCTATLIYNVLGLEFTSPFVFTLLSQGDFLKLVKNFRYYVDLPLEEALGQKGEKYPVGKIGDIEVKFPYNLDFSTAKKDWKKRVSRVNYDNILFWMRCDTYEFAEEFQVIDVDRKIGFSPMKTEFPSILWMSDLWIQYYDQMNGEFALFMHSCVRSEVSPLPFNLIDLLLDESRLLSRYKWDSVHSNYAQQEKYIRSMYNNSYNNKIRLARIYTEGYVIPKDLNKAYLILLEANIENATNRMNCIDYLSRSSNVSDNILSLRLAYYFARDGDLDAAGYLASMYRDGKGVGKDLTVAREWMQKAADGGIGWAKNELIR